MAFKLRTAHNMTTIRCSDEIIKRRRFAALRSMSVQVRAAQYTPSILVPLLCLIARINHAHYLAIASVLLAGFADFHVYLHARSLCFAAC